MICRANQRAGFYMTETILKELSVYLAYLEPCQTSIALFSQVPTDI